MDVVVTTCEAPNAYEPATDTHPIPICASYTNASPTQKLRCLDPAQRLKDLREPPQLRPTPEPPNFKKVSKNSVNI
eukprot:2262601-Amphidinium_carterae.1